MLKELLEWIDNTGMPEFMLCVGRKKYCTMNVMVFVCQKKQHSKMLNLFLFTGSDVFFFFYVKKQNQLVYYIRKMCCTLTLSDFFCCHSWKASYLFGFQWKIKIKSGCVYFI